MIVEGGRRAGNVAWEATVVRGDTDAAFARDDVTVVESEFAVGRQNQVVARAARRRSRASRTAVPSSRPRRRYPWAVRNATARLLGCADSAVRVAVPSAVGGGFGLKFECEHRAVRRAARAADGPAGEDESISREEEMLTCALPRERRDPHPVRGHRRRRDRRP